jgi:polyketide cyclase/dehydrase/lipid transport protein
MRWLHARFESACRHGATWTAKKCRRRWECHNRTASATDIRLKDTVRIEIDAPLRKVAEVFTDPANSTKWMDDLVACEPVSGTPGMPGSKYRLVSKNEQMTFTATVIARDLPNESRLVLDSPTVEVSVRTTFASLPSGRTELVSEETFMFKSTFARVFGFFARPAIRRAHRHHMESFKRFSEGGSR